MNGRYEALLLVAALFVGACAKVTVKHVTAPENPSQPLKEEGVFYALPKTVARMQVKIDKARAMSAPYMMFAPIFAPSGSALCETPKKCRDLKDKTTTTYSLQQGVAFATFGEPDPNQVYLVKFAGRGAIDQTISMAWTDTGLPSSAAASVSNRTMDLALAGVKLTTTLGAKAFLGGAGANRATEGKCPGVEDECLIRRDKQVIDRLNGIGDDKSSKLLIANYCAMGEELRKEYQEDDLTLLDNAVEAFKLRLKPYIDARHKLLTGEGGNVLDPASLIDKLDPIIDAATKDLFLGTSDKVTWEVAFEVREMDPAGKPVILLNLDPEKGPCPVASLLAFDAKPMPPNFANSALDCKQAHTPIEFHVAYHPDATNQLFESVKKRVASPGVGDERSFRYRIPAQVRATIKLAEKDYGSGVFSVAQLGHIASLPARRSSKTLSYDLAFIEATGGLKTFKLGSTGGLDAATIDALSGAGATVLDARTTARDEAEVERKAAEAAADELTIITRQNALLKLKDEICEIQKKYGLACTIP